MENCVGVFGIKEMICCYHYSKKIYSQKRTSLIQNKPRKSDVLMSLKVCTKLNICVFI
jgi:hypothetical protein